MAAPPETPPWLSGRESWSCEIRREPDKQLVRLTGHRCVPPVSLDECSPRVLEVCGDALSERHVYIRSIPLHRKVRGPDPWSAATPGNALSVSDGGAGAATP